MTQGVPPNELLFAIPIAWAECDPFRSALTQIGVPAGGSALQDGFSRFRLLLLGSVGDIESWPVKTLASEYPHRHVADY